MKKYIMNVKKLDYLFINIMNKLCLQSKFKMKLKYLN